MSDKPYDRALLLDCAALIAAEHGSTVFELEHEEYEYSQAERDQYVAEAAAVLDALATAGRLLPADAERREEWIRRSGRPYDESTVTWADRESMDRRYAAWRRQFPEGMAGSESWPVVVRNVWVGPWVEVDPKEEPPSEPHASLTEAVERIYALGPWEDARDA